MSTVKDVVYSDNVQSSMPIVMGSRVRLARNLKGYRFPKFADEAELYKVSELCKSVLIGCKALKSPKIFEIDKLSVDERFSLVESRLCSIELARSGPGSFLLVSDDNSVAIMINEEDHVRIQVFGHDLALKHLWGRVSEIDDFIISAVDVAYDDVYGFLTACPANVGSGLRASVIMHLPGLVLSKQMNSVISAVQNLGFIVNGVYSEGSNALGGIFQFANQHTLGLSENDILLRLSQVVFSICENEELARRWLLKNRCTDTRDAIGRSFGTLSNSYKIEIEEAIVHLSNMRLAIDLGYLGEEHRKDIDKLIARVQPAHIKLSMSSDANYLECDMKRAEILRQAFQHIPAPEF